MIDPEWLTIGFKPHIYSRQHTSQLTQSYKPSTNNSASVFPHFRRRRWFLIICTLATTVYTAPRSLRSRWETERRKNWFHMSMVWTCSNTDSVLSPQNRTEQPVWLTERCMIFSKEHPDDWFRHFFLSLAVLESISKSKPSKKKMDAVSASAHSDSHYLPVADSVNYMLAFISYVYIKM